MQCIAQQTYPADRVLIVDSGSNSRGYLESYEKQPSIEVRYAGEDIGFCCANNIGMQHLPAHIDYLFLLNPDAFLTPQYLEQAVQFMEKADNASVGALSGALLGYDIDRDAPTGLYDSTGVFRTWYGKWVDRSQGEACSSAASNTRAIEHVPALCGAAFFCRMQAIEQVLIRGCELLDATFYMYKEDIDLSIRLRDKGWRLAFIPDLHLYHCRGWSKNRAAMPRKLRLSSAWNELRIQRRLKQPVPIAYSCLKYAAVKFFDL